jgi:hypothetical protein
MIRPLLAVTAVLLGASGCVVVRSSVIPGAGAASGGPVDEAVAQAVRVRATDVPSGARELGLVEANGLGAAELEDVVAEFRRRVVGLGGDFGKVDSMKTKFELQTQTYQYQCGKSTCTGVRTVEVATHSVLGRAFKLSEVTSR